MATQLPLTLDEHLADDASMALVYHRAEQRARRERIVSGVLVGLFLLATHALAGIVGAYVWDLMQGGVWT